MNTFYYPVGVLGDDYLSICGSVYIHSEVLPDQSICLIECNSKEKLMKVMTRKDNMSEWDAINIEAMKTGDILDLHENGMRWEGNSLNGSPFGYGCIYNQNNQLIYSGFIYNSMKVCYGIECFQDSGFVEYEGGFYKNTRHGNGKCYDKKNNLIYEGEWFNNTPTQSLEPTLNKEMIHFALQEITLDSNCTLDLSCFKLIHYPYVHHLSIGYSSLRQVNTVHIEDCQQLCDIHIDSGCFYKNCSFNIKNCMELLHITIGERTCKAGHLELTGMI